MLCPPDAHAPQSLCCVPEEQGRPSSAVFTLGFTPDFARLDLYQRMYGSDTRQFLYC